ncbi:hypothetical protein K437DRAFT_272212 [Tilletiaria anomala UBC 951]|uniref:Endonuclease n=1 Tax=Tilletiaria anomala (strain ATCC 24038 / CBS 436.72 / UBC 951) TaxID=1037660 RepID=A0A066WJF9_TILAU|nr:uncharacterized protein K437DRAFT_272212 [Tilletiaria anomala UBC 951]KDN52693.1 hypothetical protein K437DRAFT_272212 [Tilletiaria anomala UBC 951]
MSQLLHLGIFTGGLVLGVAAGSAVVSRSGISQSNKSQAHAQATPGQPVVASGGSASSPSPSVVVDSGSSTGVLPYFSRDILKHSQVVPGPIADLLEHQAYISAYDRRLRHPSWTAEHLTAASLLAAPGPPTPAQIGSASSQQTSQPAAPGNRKFSVFKEDERIPELFRAKLADYFRSGYDRGHMVPASDAKRNQVAMDETFLLTNIAPQVGKGFNRDYWAGAEEFVRSLTKKFSDIYVFTIPLYLPQPDPTRPGKWRVTYEVIGNPPNVAVPTHFAKVVLAVSGPQSLPSPSTTAPAPVPVSGRNNAAGTSFLGLQRTNSFSLAAFVIPNAAVPNHVPLTSFIVPVDSVERSAGLNLFPPAIKSSAKALCDVVKCDIIVRDFSDRNEQIASGSFPNQKYPPGSSSAPQPLPART